MNGIDGVLLDLVRKSAVEEEPAGRAAALREVRHGQGMPD